MWVQVETMNEYASVHCHSTRVEVRRQPQVIGFHFLPYLRQGLCCFISTETMLTGP